MLHAFREHRKGHPRILYWFRTPPNVRVGRAALDEDAIRAIEESHPDVAFDWTRMLKAAPPVEPAPRTGPPGRDRREPTRPGRTGRRAQEARAGAPVVHRAPEPARPPVAAPPEPAPASEEPLAAWTVEDGESLERAAEPVPARHVEERLGREGVDRLRARYAELLARITERVTDPVRLEELRTQAERLDPDTWVTDEEARQGIEQFDAAYDALRARLGRRKRRRRGGARRWQAQQARLDAARRGGRPPGSGGSEGGDPAV